MTPRTRNRLKLLGIGVIAVVPVLASYALYWFWSPAQHTNYGALIDPRPLPDSRLQTVDGDPFAFERLRGRWILLTVDSGSCAARCQQKLWQMRQVRQAQGKEMGRIERVWLVDDRHRPGADITRDYRGTWMVREAVQAIAAQLPAERSVRDHVYLVDPLGNVMLRFPADADPKRMLKDIARLLKYSRAG